MQLEGGRFFAGAPTRDHAKRVFWNDLKTLTRPFWSGDPSESELVIRLLSGAEIYVIGMDRPERIEGQMWHGGVLDEYADMKPNTWPEHVQPVTADTGAWVDFIGVPDYAGRNAKEYKELFDMALRNELPDWRAFTWKSSDVLEPHIITAAQRSLSPAAYRQEYEASWESAPGRAYNEFNKGIDVPTGGVPFLPGVAINVTLDFNYGHHVWGLVQITPPSETAPRPRFRIFDELYLQSATTEIMCAALKDKLRGYGEQMGNADYYLSGDGRLTFYGDYSGVQHRSEATETNWEQVRKSFTTASFQYEPNPRISDRIHLVNGLFSNVEGDRSIMIDSRCRMHIDDFEYVTITLLHSSNKTAELSHAADGFSYLAVVHNRNAGLGTMTSRDLSRLTSVY